MYNFLLPFPALEVTQKNTNFKFHMVLYTYYFSEVETFIILCGKYKLGQ